MIFRFPSANGLLIAAFGDRFSIPALLSSLFFILSKKQQPSKMSAPTVEPATASFPVAGGKSSHTIANAGEARIALKIKTTDNTLYKVRPATVTRRLP